jgi:hypothetical protein
MRSLPFSFVTVVVVIVIETSFAFQTLPPPGTKKDSFSLNTNTFLSVHKKVGVGSAINPSSTDNPFREINLDLERIQDCATHFGKYPVDEIERMRDGKYDC